jgi:pimeloyl-ACP methyl ester carboxylesterase
MAFLPLRRLPRCCGASVFLSGAALAPTLTSSSSGQGHCVSFVEHAVASTAPVRRTLVTSALTYTAGAAALFVSTLVATLLFGQRRLIWIGQRKNGAQFNPAELEGIPGASVIRLSPNHIACHFRAQSGKYYASKTTLVYFHGNGDQIAWGGAFLGAAFSKLGLGFVAVEYPGYGLAGGNPSEAAVLAASEAVLRYLVSQGGMDNLVLVGQSIGCSPALTLAARGFGQKLILLSPFYSLQDMVFVAFPFLTPALRAFPFLLRDKLDNAASIRQTSFTTPTLLVHGTADEVVPFAQGESLCASFPKGTCTLLPISGAGHNDLFDESRGLVDVLARFASGCLSRRSVEGSRPISAIQT